MKRIRAFWHGLTVLVSERKAYLRSINQEHDRRRRQRHRGPLTVGQLWHELMAEQTDQHRRGHRIRYPGGTAVPSDETPLWVTRKGIDQSMLYRHQIAHVVHQALPETRPQTGQVKAAPLHAVRKRRIA
jgi:hypothetical protein